MVGGLLGVVGVCRMSLCRLFHVSLTSYRHLFIVSLLFHMSLTSIVYLCSLCRYFFHISFFLKSPFIFVTMFANDTNKTPQTQEKYLKKVLLSFLKVVGGGFVWGVCVTTCLQTQHPPTTYNERTTYYNMKQRHIQLHKQERHMIKPNKKEVLKGTLEFL